MTTMVNVRMDDETIAYLDSIGPTRSEAIRKCVVLAQRDHTDDSVRLTPTVLKRGRPSVKRIVPRETTYVPQIVQMPPINPVSPPTEEYLEMKARAKKAATDACNHPVAARLGRKPGPVWCGECGGAL